MNESQLLEALRGAIHDDKIRSVRGRPCYVETLKLLAPYERPGSVQAGETPDLIDSPRPLPVVASAYVEAHRSEVFDLEPELWALAKLGDAAALRYLHRFDRDSYEEMCKKNRRLCDQIAGYMSHRMGGVLGNRFWRLYGTRTGGSYQTAPQGTPFILQSAVAGVVSTTVLNWIPFSNAQLAIHSRTLLLEHRHGLRKAYRESRGLLWEDLEREIAKYGYKGAWGVILQTLRQILEFEHLAQREAA